LTGSVTLGILGAATWLLRRRIIRTTLVVDRDQDRITQGIRLIARASDVQAVHVSSRQHPAVLVLRDGSTERLRNSALPHVERGDSHVVGSMLAGYLEVSLMRVDPQAIPAASSQIGAAA